MLPYPADLFIIFILWCLGSRRLPPRPSAKEALLRRPPLINAKVMLKREVVPWRLPWLIRRKASCHLRARAPPTLTLLLCPTCKPQTRPLSSPTRRPTPSVAASESEQKTTQRNRLLRINSRTTWLSRLTSIKKYLSFVSLIIKLAFCAAISQMHTGA